MGRLHHQGAEGPAVRGGARARTPWRARVIAAATTLTLAVTGSAVLGGPASATPEAPSVDRAITVATAVGVDYPSWEDVRRAKRKKKSAREMVRQIRADIQQLQTVVERKEAAAREKGEIYATAQEAYDTAAYEFRQLKREARAAEREADAAMLDAARSISEIGRTGGGDLTATLLTQSGDADNLLYRLGAASRIGERSSETYERAIELQQQSEALGDQAKVARDEVKSLRRAAQKAFASAQAAAEQAEADLAAERAAQEQLQAQLATLTNQAAATERQYNRGVRAGKVEAGWALPANGCITSNFGQRYHPIYHYWTLHSGVDIGAAYDAPIYAASAGTVIYAGWYSDLGYYVKIDHGNGITSGYGHIRSGGLRVSVGEKVNAGQLIAKVGSTGGSTGAHLHFMIYKNGALTDPVPFMRDKGIRIGC